MLNEEAVKFFKSKNCLVTGGTGMIGREVAKLLVDAGANVKVISLDNIKIHEKIDHVYGDLTDFTFSRGQLTAKISLKKGKGCSKCNNTGFKGRRGIYEVLKITPNIQNAILKNMTAPEIMEIAKKEGYRPMQEVGVDFLKSGELAFDEYQRTLFVG